MCWRFGTVSPTDGVAASRKAPLVCQDTIASRALDLHCLRITHSVLYTHVARRYVFPVTCFVESSPTVLTLFRIGGRSKVVPVYKILSSRSSRCCSRLDTINHSHGVLPVRFKSWLTLSIMATPAADIALAESKTGQQQSSSLLRLTALVGNALLEQWFLISLFSLVLFSSQVQVPRQGQDIKDSAVNSVTIAVIFFINGCTVPTEALVSSLKAWRCHLFIQAMSFFVTSATTLGVVAAVATNEMFLDPALLNGLVVLGCLPTAYGDRPLSTPCFSMITTTASNLTVSFSFTTIMTGKSKGNTALSLTQSVMGNIMGPVISTSLVQLYSSRAVWYTRMLATNSSAGYGDVFGKVFMQFGLTLFLPLVCFLPKPQLALP